MKKTIFKDQVVITLITINIIAMLFMVSDFENIIVFHLVHLLALLIFVVNTLLIKKYGKRFID